MDFGFESFDSADFDIELEDFEVKRKKKFDRIWQWSLGGSVPAHKESEGIIYMSSTDMHVYAVDSTTGKILWKFRSGGVIFGSADVFKDIVAFGTFDGYLYALDRKIGRELWRFKTGGQISVGPTITDNSIFVGSKDGYMYCIGHDGSLKWRFRTSDDVACAISFYENRIFFGGFDYNLYCLDAKSGKELWRFRTGGEVIYDSHTTVENGRIYFGSFDNNVYCLDTETGREIWKARIGKYGITCPVVEMDGRFYVGTREGNMFCLDSEGKELWRFVTGGMIIRLSCRDGKIYVPSEDGNLYVVSEKGEELWRFNLGQGGSFDSPSFIGNMVFIGSMDCHLYAIDESTRNEIWRVNTSSTTPSAAPKPHEEFSFELKKETHVEEAIQESRYKKGKNETVSLSDYQFTSEYSSSSEYRQKSDYDVNLTIFENIIKTEELPCLLNSEDSNPLTLTSSWKISK
jgi:outer membrane protein assembly factor BamB